MFFNFIVVILPVLEEISDLGVLNGSSVNLTCTGSSAEGNVSITWNTPIPGITLPEPTQTPLDGNNVTSFITLDSVSSGYSGVYVCNISNELSSVAKNFTLSVISKCLCHIAQTILLQLVQYPHYVGISEVQDAQAIAGRNISFLCDASGHPHLEYSWERDPTPFNFTGEGNPAHFDGLQSNTLTIINVVEADAMNYTCSVSLYGELIGAITASLEILGDLRT